VAELLTVDNFKLQVCHCITVVTTQIIEVISTKPIILNKSQVVVAGNDLLSVKAICSYLSKLSANTTLTFLVQAVVISASVIAVV